MAIAFEILALFVVPFLITKTVEGRLHSIEPYLREIWFGVGFLYFLLVLLRSEGNQQIMSLRMDFGSRYPVGSYFFAAACGVLLFSGYWYFLGRALPVKANNQPSPQHQEPPKPAPVQQQSSGTASPNTSIIGNNNKVTNNITINSHTRTSKLVQPTFKENSSTATVFLGGGGMSFTRSIQMLRQMPWEPFLLRTKDNSIFSPVSIRVLGDTLLVSTQVGGGPRPIIQVLDNEFTVNNSFFDRNSNDRALEVVTDNGAVIFQLIQKSPTSIVLNGIFPTPDGGLILAGPEGTLTGATASDLERFKLKPIFKYPAWKYPGQYAD